MNSRHNFLDADNSIMERNLRFVKNDLEDNLNQYFGGAGSRGSNTAISAPPRDYKVVQPKPGEVLWKEQTNKLGGKISSNLKGKKKKEENSKHGTQRRKNPLGKPLTDHAIIPSGFKKPQPGFSKAKPQEYWSLWWPRYKYIEESLPQIENWMVKNVINFLLKPEEPLFLKRKSDLLRLGINKILRNLNINEKNYAFRDTFKLFKYKKHLEDHKFHDHLDKTEMDRVRSTLENLENKKVMALLHQSLISRWHISSDVIKRGQAGENIKMGNANNLLEDRVFHYLVKESLQQLKEICRQDWPEFGQFFNSLDVTHQVVNLSTFGIYLDLMKNNEAKEDNDDDGDNNDWEEEGDYSYD